MLGSPQRFLESMGKYCDVGAPHKIAKLGANNCNFTRVDWGVITIFRWGYKPTDITRGAPHCGYFSVDLRWLFGGFPSPCENPAKSPKFRQCLSTENFWWFFQDWKNGDFFSVKIWLVADLFIKWTWWWCFFWLDLNGISMKYWLVVWLPWILFSHSYWVANHPNWLSYFSEGWSNHQPE